MSRRLISSPVNVGLLAATRETDAMQQQIADTAPVEQQTYALRGNRRSLAILPALAGAVMLAADYGGGAAGRGGMGGYRLSPEERAKRRAAKASRADALLAKAEAKRERRRQRNARLQSPPSSPETPNQ